MKVSLTLEAREAELVGNAYSMLGQLEYDKYFDCSDVITCSECPYSVEGKNEFCRVATLKAALRNFIDASENIPLEEQ